MLAILGFFVSTEQDFLQIGKGTRGFLLNQYYSADVSVLKVFHLEYIYIYLSFIVFFFMLNVFFIRFGRDGFTLVHHGS